METGIKVEYTAEDAEGLTSDEKLTLLLKIAFSNHNVVSQHTKILFGNGSQGLCDVVRTQGKGLKFLYTTFLLTSGGLAGFLFAHLSK